VSFAAITLCVASQRVYFVVVVVVYFVIDSVRKLLDIPSYACVPRRRQVCLSSVLNQTHAYIKTDVLISRLIMRGDITPLPQYVFMPWCLVKQGVLLHGVMPN
jgi:hypothetical protein